MKKFNSILLILTFITSCASNENKDEKLQKDLNKIWEKHFTEEFNETRAVNVIIVSNRKVKDDKFGCDDERLGIQSDNKLNFGSCKVNVPKNHITGTIEYTKDGRRSSNDYFKILESETLNKKDIIKILKKSKQTPLVFVHGFNVRSEEAILRTAGIAYDLKYQGPVILFTWPAGGENGFFEERRLNKIYENNFTNAKSSIEVFQNFLLDLQKEEIKINLIVHSMGHQVILPALKNLGEKSDKVFINELILNAPDFDVNEFKALTKNIKSTSKHTTLYCSYNDKAMYASKTFNKSDRFGACAYQNDLDTINVSLVDDTILGLGHGYYSSRAILTDVFQTLLGIDAEKRLFIIKSEPNSTEKYYLRQ